MNTKKALVEEFENRVFKESYGRIFKCLTLIEEKQLWESPQKNIPAIGNLILHLCGNARQWILSGIGGEQDNRNRDQEFEIQTKIRKSELIFLLENLRMNLHEVLIEMSENELFISKRIQGFNTSNFSAMIHVIEHFSYHTGQITTLTKWLTNKETGYYSKFDLNQLN
ncbi:MAG: DinB family protein [Flavobacteriia bacterium]|jgi:uncharacterized damage-inducible protein DinB